VSLLVYRDDGADGHRVGMLLFVLAFYRFDRACVTVFGGAAGLYLLGPESVVVMLRV
jgi:hypothetical protein